MVLYEVHDVKVTCRDGPDGLQENEHVPGDPIPLPERANTREGNDGLDRS
jgi:hypothetical protein